MTPADPRDPPPTEPLHPREPHVREGVPAEVADTLWVQRLEDQVRSLKGLVALLGVLAAAALGVAVWALLSSEDDDGGRTASADRVARLDARVDQLEDDVAEVAKQSDTTQLRDDLDQKASKADVDALSGQVEELSSSLDASATDENAAAISELQGRVDSLAQQVEALSAGGP